MFQQEFSVLLNGTRYPVRTSKWFLRVHATGVAGEITNHTDINITFGLDKIFF